MPNKLTGDFEAVLQVSAATVNRLLATLHQNAFTNSNLPSFPHLVRMRIGDDHPIDGVRGLVYGQVGAPRAELIHGVSDRFWLEVGVRVWYRPDGGTTPLPAFIHGTVRAAYHFEKIDPSCLGWAKLATQYLWVRVIQDSVTFQGTTAEDKNAIAEAIGLSTPAEAAAEDASIAKVQRQIAGLLAHQFEATPHPLKPGFRRDLMRSLNVPLAGSSVAVALGLSVEPAGSINSVEHPFLDDADIGLAINIDFLFGLAQPMLDKVAQFNMIVPVHKDLPLKDFDTVYRVRVDPPSIAWEPNGWYGVIKVKVHGTAKTDSIAADATFDVDQNIILQFDAGRGTIVASAASPLVKTHADGLYAGTVADKTYGAVFAAVDAIAKAAVGQIQPMLDAIPSRTDPLVTQLKTLDQQAAIGFTEGVFLDDGIIIRGFVALSPRQAPVVVQAVLPTEDGHSAIESWIPGGRIDRFDWSWTWITSSLPGGKSTLHDRFVLRRPSAKTSRWGVGVGIQTPIPGLDGWGTLCLKITGVHTDATTGALVKVESSIRCHRFGLNISDRVRDKDRLFLRDMPELSTHTRFPQLAVQRVGDAHVASAAANTLVVFAGERWSEDDSSAIRHGLERCGRYDTGLSLLILFDDGVLDVRGSRTVAELEELAREVGIRALVNEDVHGGWSRALGMKESRGEVGWALVSPDGAVTWRHDGRLSGDVLTRALDAHLSQSADASASPVLPRLEVGSTIAGGLLSPGLIDQVESHCPPLPLGRGGAKETVVTFVAREARASADHLRQLYSDYGQVSDGTPLVVVVIDGADAREAEALRNDLGIDFVTVPDPHGAISDRIGVNTWPTTITLDETGTVSRMETGLRPPRC